MVILGTCAAIATHCRGLWAWLVRREDRRQAVETYREHGLHAIELEQARTAGTVAIVEALARGGEVIETDPGGRSRRISMPERQSHSIVRWVITDSAHSSDADDLDQPGELTP